MVNILVLVVEKQTEKDLLYLPEDGQKYHKQTLVLKYKLN